MYPILSTIDQPSDLQGLSPAQLDELAREIRDFLVKGVSETGGHLSSNLGTVELTLALHRAFESPKDKLVWDVGHQAYVHKIITGRRDQFATIRQYQGLCGYLERSESEHDQFGAGHAGTSISAAFGMAMARDLNHEDNHVVAIIGDGALTSGMALEAINHAGHVGTRFIVVLNDNEMSISPNVGGLGRAMNTVRMNPRYMQAKKDAERIMTNLPMGEELWHAGENIKRSIKGMVVPSAIWEAFGFDYIGPVDGHSRTDLEAAFETAKGVQDKPVFIHVLTTKGKGYDLAELDSVKWHGVSPPSAPGAAAPAPSYSKVFAQTFATLAKQRPNVVAISAAMLEGTALATVVDQLPPERIIDVGISEQHAVTLAAGMATQGIVPVVAIYSTFLQRGFDQVVHDVALQDLHVVFALDRGGLVGDDGKTHQGIFDLAYLRCIPNMVVAAPKDEDELQHMLLTGLEHDGPYAVRFPRGNGLGVTMHPPHSLEIGVGEVVRPGSDVTVVAIGGEVGPAMEAAADLAAQGMDCEVINARWVKPLDRDLIVESVRKTGRLVTVEENVVQGGFGSAVLEMLADAGIEVPSLLIGLPDQFIEHGTQKILRSKYGIDRDAIATRVREFLAPVPAKRLPLAG